MKLPKDDFRMALAIESGEVCAKKIAAERGADWPRLVGAFLLAAQVDAVDGVLKMLDAGVAVDSRDANGATAAMCAAACDSPKTLRILLDRGADREARMPDGRGVMELAIAKKATSCLALLASDAERGALEGAVPGAPAPSDSRRL